MHCALTQQKITAQKHFGHIICYCTKDPITGMSELNIILPLLDN